ncbi:MAG TPA: hypothetical protein VH593_27750, partial [Ktedonobacteraceae bacterium]
MLDHDELLPEEKAHPGLVQELQAIYLMKPEEKQVLSRVYQRLEQNSSSLPLSDPVQAGNQAQLLRFNSPTATRLRSAEARPGWPRLLNILAATLILGLLVGSLGLAFALASHTNVGSQPCSTTDLCIFLVPAEQGGATTRSELETTGSILSH